MLRENVIHEHLEEQLNGTLPKNRQENSLANECGSGRLSGQAACRMCPTHREGDGKDNEEINVKILEVAQHGVDVITNHNGYELNDGVKGHEFETLKGSHQRTSSCLKGANLHYFQEFALIFALNSFPLHDSIIIPFSLPVTFSQVVKETHTFSKEIHNRKDAIEFTGKARGNRSLCFRK
jgi:hypothetical protein